MENLFILWILPAWSKLIFNNKGYFFAWYQQQLKYFQIGVSEIREEKIKKGIFAQNEFI